VLIRIRSSDGNVAIGSSIALLFQSTLYAIFIATQREACSKYVGSYLCTVPAPESVTAWILYVVVDPGVTTPTIPKQLCAALAGEYPPKCDELE
jgi:hypothetical protein